MQNMSQSSSWSTSSPSKAILAQADDGHGPIHFMASRRRPQARGRTAAGQRDDGHGPNHRNGDSVRLHRQVFWSLVVWIQTSCRLLLMRRWPFEEAVARLLVLGLPCCTQLVESMFRTCLWCVLLRGCALGDVAATGTCILWMLGLHGSTAASCRAFSLLVMLGLDARSFSLEGKVLLCAVVAVAPIFPPKTTSADYMREWRDYRAQHGSVPVETPNSAGYALAIRIRKARDRHVFDAAELAELDSPIPGPAAAQSKSPGAVAASARVAQPRKAPAKATPAGSGFSSALGGSSSGSGARSSSDIARPSDLLIVGATESQVPDSERDGGELMLDVPPPWRSTAGDRYRGRCFCAC